MENVIALILAVVYAQGNPAAKSERAAPSAVRADSAPANASFIVQSKALAEARPVNVHVPPRSRVSEPLPVLYMPDGGLAEDFPHVVRAVDSLIASGVIRPVIVVGVPNTQRRRDLTGPTAVKSDSSIAPVVGGSAAFRTFLRDELIPEVERRYRTTRERAIVGESLAGLFVMETFLNEPGLFTHYVALDPSLWWNNGALVDAARARIAAFGATPRSLYLASSAEPSTATGCAKIAALLTAAAPRGLHWSYTPRPDLTHANIFSSLELTALTEALR